MYEYKLPTFIKWAGGKRSLIPQLSGLFPEDMKTYFEPFLGGGAIFFYIKQKFNPDKCIISDINEELINVYIAVRDNPKRLAYYLNQFQNLNTEKDYYQIRKKFNQHQLKQTKRCAAFIYLNKTCFNGLYRVNSKNEFNVPYGRYKNPQLFNKDNLLFASKLLQGTDIKLQDYKQILSSAKRGDFVYLDPCYDPLKKTSFVQYTPKGFCVNDRLELARFTQALNKKNCFFLLSNNELPEIRHIYKQFKITDVFANRFINSNATARGITKELAITNYKGG